MSDLDPVFGVPAATCDACPRCAGALYHTRAGDDRRFCVCGYFRPAPPRSAARVLVVGAEEFRRTEEVLDKLTANLRVGWVLAHGGTDPVRRWAVLHEKNWVPCSGMTAWGRVNTATHVVCFGAPEEALFAEDLRKPCRIVRR